MNKWTPPPPNLCQSKGTFVIIQTCGSPGTNVRQHWHPSLISFGTSGRHRRATRTGITLTSSFDMFEVSARKIKKDVLLQGQETPDE